jgi:23S rRNA pseudouridine1911/1915/1917 synthase
MADRELVVDEAERLDRWLRRAVPGLSRRLAHRLIADGAVRVDGRRARKGTRLGPGARVLLPDLSALVADHALILPVVHEDASLVAVDKPGGMPSHPLDPREGGTVVAFLLARYPETAALAGGLVHRLDTGTSGLLLAARSSAAWAALRAAFRARAVEKRYLALVAGRAGDATVDVPLAHDPRDPRRMIAARPGLRAWPAESRITRIASDGETSLVAVVMRTGVTHQIRVHLAELGHPVLGDRLYGGPPAGLPPRRHALHATGLVLPAMDGRPALAVESPLPGDLVALAPA